MKYIDSHCHLNMDELAGNLGAVLRSARESNVLRLLVAGFDEPSSAKALALAKSHVAEGVFAAVGIHPHDAKTCPLGRLPENMSAWVRDERVVAIGETGLDYHYDLSPRELQRECFRQHIALAARTAKPLVVHVREAYDEALGILRENAAGKNCGVIHCFAGEWRHAVESLDLGFFVSFAGPVTFPRSTVLREVAARVPLDRLLCETDSPYLAPQPWRGKPNQPAYVSAVYETIAEVRKIPVETLAEQVWQNAARLFGWGV
ncbi:MAG: TatD family hydrolase [Synergistales bacterium]